IAVEEVFRLVRGAAPFSSLTRAAFTGVLDLLAGRYPSDEFADLRPRITWDRARDTLAPREGAKGLAILNGGTIPDRGLYGVFLSGGNKKPGGGGELLKRRCFEGAVADGDLAGGPLEFGRRICALVRELRSLPVNAAISRLVREHDLDTEAAES